MNLIAMVVTAVAFLISSRLGALLLLSTLYCWPKEICTSGY